jgi:serine/tyrosine/threonine adenylyltransferase
VPRGDGQDRAAIQAIEQALRATEGSIDRFFFDAFGGTLPDDDSFAEARAALTGYQPRKARDHAYWQGEPCSMLIEEVEAIWAAIDQRDDWAPLHAKVAAIRDMGEALA